MLIRIWIERTQPLAGTAATEGSDPLRFDGWLELLRVISELVAAAPSGGEDADATAKPMQGNQTGDDTRVHPESLAREQLRRTILIWRESSRRCFDTDGTTVHSR